MPQIPRTADIIPSLTELKSVNIVNRLIRVDCSTHTRSLVPAANLAASLLYKAAVNSFPPISRVKAATAPDLAHGQQTPQASSSYQGYAPASDLPLLWTTFCTRTFAILGLTESTAEFDFGLERDL